MKKIIIPILTILITTIALAQSSGGDFEITKSTIDSGGGTSSGGDFSMTGTIGQHDANWQPSTGEGFSVTGGFWVDAGVSDAIFKDGFESY